MSQPPYWGQLPGPKVRRMSMSDDYHDQTEHKQSQPQPRANRASTQTAYTDAPSESTFSPISPISPSFHGAGLAPRPPSFQQPQHQHQYHQQHLQEPRHTQLPPELVEKRRKRSGQEPPRDVASTYAPAPAPDVPRAAPPLDYQHPYGNGGLHQYQAELAPHPTSSYTPNTQSMQANITDLTVEPESYYTASDLDHLRQRYHDGDGGDYHLARDAMGSRSTRQPPMGGSGGRNGNRPMRTDSTATRRTSTSATDPTRSNSKTWADDRSPLQRLELTLDSITKEEKRARVEAAERRARERAAATAALAEEETSGIGVDRLKVPEPGRSAGGGGHGSGSGGQQQVRFRGDEKRRKEPASIFASAALDLQQQQQELEKESRQEAGAIHAEGEPANTQQFLSLENNNQGGTGEDTKRKDINGLSPRSRIAAAINHSVENSQPQSQAQKLPPVQSQPLPAPQSQAQPALDTEFELPPLEPLPPQRNLSFRERASKNNAGVDLPPEPPGETGSRRRGGGEHGPAPLSPLIPTTSPTNGGSFSLTRSGSNKLRKNPPGDPWYNVRRDAEERSAAAAAPTVPYTAGGRAHVATHEEPQMTPANVARSRSMGSGGATLKKPPPSIAYRDAVGGPPPPSRAGRFADHEEAGFAGFAAHNQARGPTGGMGLDRANTIGNTTSRLARSSRGRPLLPSPASGSQGYRTPQIQTRMKTGRMEVLIPVSGGIYIVARKGPGR